MRIVHLTDIHLSSTNLDEFRENYRGSLIDDLKNYDSEKKIDLIVITGDLVDQGGHSLTNLPEFVGTTNPYQIFEKEFIEPICKAVGISNNNLIFIPGNHDIDENEILWIDEKKMKKDLVHGNLKEYLKKNSADFNYSNLRIKNFKEFEQKFHYNNSNYSFTNNESTYIYTYEKQKIGFILINDSWRCSTCNLTSDEDEKIFFGTSQIYDALRQLDQTNLNICLFHHSISNYKEESEINRILNTKNIEMYLFGHYHSSKFEINYTATGKCMGIRGRAALNKPDEKLEEFQSGYQIIDLDVQNYKINCIHYRKYSYKNAMFIPDNETAPPDGKDVYKDGNFQLSRENRIVSPLALDKQKFIKE